MEIQSNTCPVTRLGSNCILLLFFSWHPCRQGWVDHDLFPLSSLLLCSLLVVFNSFYLFHFFSILLLLFLGLLMQSLIPVLVFIASFSLPLSGHLLSAIFHLPFSTWPARVNFFCKTFLHSKLHSPSVHASLISSLNSHDSSYQVVFGNLDLLRLFFC